MLLSNIQKPSFLLILLNNFLYLKNKFYVLREMNYLPKSTYLSCNLSVIGRPMEED